MAAKKDTKKETAKEAAKADLLREEKMKALESALAQLNKTYGNDKVAFSPYLTQLRQEIYADTIRKIETEA